MSAGNHRVRVDAANRYRDDPTQQQLIKGARWVLLCNLAAIKSDAGRQHLDELLAANRELSTVYIMKEHLNHLWNHTDMIAAKAWWHQWYQMAITSDIDAFAQFASKLAVYLDGLLSYTKYRLTTGVLDGMNNKIKVIKRVAYDFRDDEYFLLRIRHAFPGTLR